MTKQNVVALVAGVLFGIGLVVAGMTNPAKVVGFLDFAGSWDASLAFVMVGAIGVHLVLGRLVRRRRAPVFDVAFHLPTRKDIDPRLIAGAAIFGIGWGLGGFCPGPAVVSAGSGSLVAAVFVGTMLAGIALDRALEGRLALPKASPGSAPEPVEDDQPCG